MANITDHISFVEGQRSSCKKRMQTTLEINNYIKQKPEYVSQYDPKTIKLINDKDDCITGPYPKFYFKTGNRWYETYFD